MHPFFWIALGLTLGLIGMTPVIRLLLQRAEARARHAERRARQSERLAELGSMTSGLAHEIKNPLSTIGLNAQLLAENIEETSLPDDERHRLLRRLGSLRREVDRLRGILTDFLQFAGRMKLDPHPLDLGELINDLCDFYHPQCDQAGIVLRSRLPESPVVVSVDDALLKQAVLNLMINATQAMAPEEGISATPNANTNSATRPELMLRLDADPDEARIHVIDTGPGIDPERLQEIFRPYVSHKSRGTGLGLPTARRIIDEHRGRLEVHSEPGRGSDFVIHLPRGGT